jgi:polyisoprenoid-binding protein YceI
VTFRSKSITADGDGYKVASDLTIRGETRPVILDAEISGIVQNLQGGRRAAFNAEAKISRKAFGLTWNVALESGGWLVGDEIRISIDLAVLQAEAAVEETASAIPFRE